MRNGPFSQILSQFNIYDLIFCSLDLASISRGMHATHYGDTGQMDLAQTDQLTRISSRRPGKGGAKMLELSTNNRMHTSHSLGCQYLEIMLCQLFFFLWTTTTMTDGPLTSCACTRCKVAIGHPQPGVPAHSGLPLLGSTG